MGFALRVMLATALLGVPALPATATIADCPHRQAGLVTTAPGKGRTVALTFDDGPARWTRPILDELARLDVVATFFDTGAHARKRPADVRAVVAGGHALGGHTWDHRYPRDIPGGWTKAYLRDQFSRTAAVQKKLTGQASCVVRMPGGNRSPGVEPAARSLGLTVWGWSVDTQDWRQPAHRSAEATSTIVRAAKTGLGRRHPVILLHAGKASHETESRVSSYRGNTVAALPAIVRAYRAEGYRFVKLG